MSSKGDGNQCCGIVEERFDRVHPNARESSRIVCFVMKRMKVRVQEFANVGNFVQYAIVGIWSAPRMDGTMDHEKVSDPIIWHRENPEPANEGVETVSGVC